MTKWEPPPRHSAASVYRPARRVQRFYVPEAVWTDEAGRAGFGGGYVELDIDEWGFVREPPRERARAGVVATVLVVMWLATLVTMLVLGVMLATSNGCGAGDDAWWCTRLGRHVRVTIPWVAAPLVGAAGTVGVVAGGRLTRRLTFWGWPAGLVTLWVVVLLLLRADPAAW